MSVLSRPLDSATIRAEATTVGAPVSFRSISKIYGNTKVLEGFSLSVEPGEFVTLLGPSGSGKTTALNILAGFTAPSGGDVLIDGMPVTSLPSERRNIGMVFQNYSLFPHNNLRENVAFPLRMRGVPKAERLRRADQALEMVHLTGYGARMPHELSGGQRQRVAIARAIVFRPRVLLMDEPLGALDLKLREAMQEEIRRVQRDVGCTVIYVTHDQNEAMAMSDKIVVMQAGGIEQVGTPAEIYDLPRSAFVARFIGEANLLPAWVSAAGLHLAESVGAWPALPHVAEGWSGLLVLRPEHMARSEAAVTQPCLQCEITAVAFHGDMFRYAARAAGIEKLTIYERRAGMAAPLKVGDRVAMRLDISRAVFLDPEPTSRSPQ